MTQVPLSSALRPRCEIKKSSYFENDSVGNSRKDHALSFDIDVWYLPQVSNIFVTCRIVELALAQPSQVFTIYLFI